MAKHTFIVNDENEVNTYGYRVLTSGIRLKTYRTNPLVLWMHKRVNGWNGANDKDKEVFPIGTATKVWREEGLLKAEVEFDQGDEFAKKIEQKVEAGIIRMCSMGFDVVSKSEDAKFLLQGQTRPTVTQCELFEISIVDMGANRKALKLYNTNFEELKIDDVLPEISKQTLNTNTETMKLAIEKLNSLGAKLDDNATDEQIATAIGEFVKAPESGALNQKVIDALLAAGKKTGNVTDKNEAAMKKLASEQPDLFVDLIDIDKLSVNAEAPKPGKDEAGTKDEKSELRLSDVLAQLQGGAKAPKKEKWEDYSQPELEELEKKEPETYAKLYKGHFGVELKAMK